MHSSTSTICIIINTMSVILLILYFSSKLIFNARFAKFRRLAYLICIIFYIHSFVSESF